jgi:hypothetical protein
MSDTRTLENVPADDVDQVIADYQSEGAISVVKQLQPDGTWTVVATFP